MICPWHGYAIDVHTGEVEGEPELKAQVFEAKVEDGELQARI